MDEFIHLSGPVIQVRERIIQRCVLCGCKLFDNEENFGNFWPTQTYILEMEDGFKEIFDGESTPDKLCLFTLVD